MECIPSYDAPTAPLLLSPNPAMYVFLGFLLHLLLLPSFAISQEQPKASPAVAVTVEQQPTAQESSSNTDLGGVIDLTSATLDPSLRDGSVWLIEFYAPWCRHCNTFAPTYAKLAYTIHARNQDKKESERTIKVAKINGDKEQASTSRFNIQGYPSFFLIDGWQVYQYDGPRTEHDLMNFVVREGYKDQNVRACCFHWLLYLMGPMKVM
jgi:protein disulfide-isomerase-like protein